VSHLRTLTDTDRDLIRLVASGHTNEEIAAKLGTSIHTLRSRLRVVHGLIGTNPGPVHDSTTSRVRMAAWAYENDLMGPVRTGTSGGGPAELSAELLDVCRAIVNNRPRGDLRALALRALRAARGAR
jgi:hypothetical protein